MIYDATLTENWFYWLPSLTKYVVYKENEIKIIHTITKCIIDGSQYSQQIT
jgi:vacuolar-type H+-ATPase subunit C/Vma6